MLEMGRLTRFWQRGLSALDSEHAGDVRRTRGSVTFTRESGRCTIGPDRRIGHVRPPSGAGAESWPPGSIVFDGLGGSSFGPRACAGKGQPGHIRLAGELGAPGALLRAQGAVRVDLPLEPREEGLGRGTGVRPALCVERERADAGAERSLARGHRLPPPPVDDRGEVAGRESKDRSGLVGRGYTAATTDRSAAPMKTARHRSSAAPSCFVAPTVARRADGMQDVPLRMSRRGRANR